MSKHGVERPFGSVLVRMREDRGLSKTEVARGAGITLGNLWKYEHGRVEPGRSMVKRLAKGLGVDAEELEREISSCEAA